MTAASLTAFGEDVFVEELVEFIAAKFIAITKYQRLDRVGHS